MTTPPNAVAVIRPADTDGHRLNVWQAEHNLTGATVYRADQLDDVERAIRSGHVRRVELPDINPLLEAVWEQEIDLDYWLTTGVQIELPEPDGAAQVRLLTRINTTWRDWNERRRRRNARFAAALSLAVMVLAAGWTWWALATGSA